MRRCLTCHGRFEASRLVCALDSDFLFDEGRPAPETGRLLEDRYRLGNLLGEGGMGKVFEAERVAPPALHSVPAPAPGTLGAPAAVALKILKEVPESSSEGRTLAEKRFFLEASTEASIDHPGIVKVFESRRSSEGTSYFVMERLYGATFDELRRAGKLASPERILELLREVCEALAAAHDRGVVHRDLKPSNLFLHREAKGVDRVKILDFGIAKTLDRLSERLTSTGEFLGTLLYMAPELIAGQEVTRAADVYSLGVILFEAIAGKVPFAVRSPLELLRLHASMPAPILSDFQPGISAELDEVVSRCLSKRPERRPRDARELSRALAGIPALRPAGERSAAATRSYRTNPANWIGAILDDRYEIIEWITPGRFGSDVFRALHRRTGASLAVRLWRVGEAAVRDALLAACRKESRAMGVRHPNLITFLDLGFTDECVYIVTELVEGISLRALLAGGRGLPPGAAARLARGAAGALRVLHERGIVSGGLSPETIRVALQHRPPGGAPSGGPGGPIAAPAGPPEPASLLITPFGLTSLQQLHSLLSPARVAAIGDRSFDYIAPEQRGGAEPDARSDLYSLALILLEMLGGKVPEREPPTAWKHGERTQPEDGFAAEALATLPPESGPLWGEFLARALARDPAARFADAGAFLAAMPEDAGT